MNSNKMYCDLNTPIDEIVYEFNRLRDIVRERGDKKFYITFLLSSEEALSIETYDKINQIFSQLRQNGINAKNTVFSINDKVVRYDEQDWRQIRSFAKALKKVGSRLGFEDMNKTWDIEQVENANRQIDIVVDEIKQKCKTPLEKIMYAYLSVIEREYIANDKLDHASESRSIYSVLNGEKIVCVGYSELLKTILEKSNIKGVQVFSNTTRVNYNDHYGKHRNLFMYIKDEAYGVDGLYYFDPTWDCMTNGRMSLSHFLVPINEIGAIAPKIESVEELPSHERANLHCMSRGKYSNDGVERHEVLYGKNKNSRGSYNISSVSSDSVKLCKADIMELVKNRDFIDAFVEVLDEKELEVLDEMVASRKSDDSPEINMDIIDSEIVDLKTLLEKLRLEQKNRSIAFEEEKNKYWSNAILMSGKKFGEAKPQLIDDVRKKRARLTEIDERIDRTVGQIQDLKELKEEYTILDSEQLVIKDMMMDLNSYNNIRFTEVMGKVGGEPATFFALADCLKKVTAAKYPGEVSEAIFDSLRFQTLRNISTKVSSSSGYYKQARKYATTLDRMGKSVKIATDRIDDLIGIK